MSLLDTSMYKDVKDSCYYHVTRLLSLVEDSRHSKGLCIIQTHSRGYQTSALHNQMGNFLLFSWVSSQ